MMGLARHAPAETLDLLVRFTEYANGAQPVHPSKPTMSQEEQLARPLSR
jgi:hypothetical protein